MIFQENLLQKPPQMSMKRRKPLKMAVSQIQHTLQIIQQCQRNYCLILAYSIQQIITERSMFGGCMMMAVLPFYYHTFCHCDRNGHAVKFAYLL